MIIASITLFMNISCIIFLINTHFSNILHRPRTRMPPQCLPPPNCENTMGPFPHNAPPASISAQNPVGTDGFEFVEFAHPRPDELSALFARMGYAPVARHKTKAITVYRQGDINYLLNAEPGSFAARFVAMHGPCAASMAWRVVDAKHAFQHAVRLGA